MCMCVCLHIVCASKYTQMYLYRHHVRDTSKLHINFIHLSLKFFYTLYLNPVFFGLTVYNSTTSLRTILIHENPLPC